MNSIHCTGTLCTKAKDAYAPTHLCNKYIICMYIYIYIYMVGRAMEGDTLMRKCGEYNSYELIQLIQTSTKCAYTSTKCAYN